VRFSLGAKRSGAGIQSGAQRSRRSLRSGRWTGRTEFTPSAIEGLRMLVCSQTETHLSERQSISGETKKRTDENGRCVFNSAWNQATLSGVRFSRYWSTSERAF
jgi:hypothetical protein